MVELVRGIKAGIVAGLIYGVFAALWSFAGFALIASLLNVPITPPPFGGKYVTWSVNPLAYPIIGLIFGVILGIIYAFVYNRLPEKTFLKWTVSMTKGAILALIVWIIMFLITVPTGFSTGLFFHELAEYRTFQIIMTAFAFWIFIILGQQLGYFWDKFKPKQSKNTHI